MIIIGISDIHNDLRCLVTIAHDLCAADVVVLSGDITNFGDKTEAADVISELKVYNKNVLAVPGNCDSDHVAKYFTSQEINVDRKCKIIGDVAFVGIGGSLPCPGKTPYEIFETEFRDGLKAAGAGVGGKMPLILLTHQPPYGASVDIAVGRHVGSQAIREFIMEARPAVCFSGHIHEARGVDRIEDTVVINPGPLRQGGYAYVELNGTVKTAEIRGI